MIREEYVARSPFIGCDVKIRRGDEWIYGRACGLTSSGALELLTTDGVLRSVELGEMFSISGMHCAHPVF
jgi:biotin-(acetyl-CoA carboxylase) ligase